MVSPGTEVPSVPEGESWAQQVAREGCGGTGTWLESALPGHLWLWVLAVVGASPDRGSSMGARKGNRHPGCQGTAPALEVSCGEIPWQDAEAASLPGHSEWLPAPSQ